MAVAMARSAGPPPARGAAAAARGPSPACAARSAAQRATISFILRAAARAERGGPGAGLGQSPRLPAHDGTWSLGALSGARGRPCPDYRSQGASGVPCAHWLLGIQGGVRLAREHPSLLPRVLHSQLRLSNIQAPQAREQVVPGFWVFPGYVDNPRLCREFLSMLV